LDFFFFIFAQPPLTLVAKPRETTVIGDCTRISSEGFIRGSFRWRFPHDGGIRCLWLEGV
jgi:hypothetical protein